MLNTSIKLGFKFDTLNSPLSIGLSYCDEVLTYTLNYDSHTLDIDYNTEKKLAQASWHATDSQGLKLSELLTLSGFSELDSLADHLNIALKSFSLDYDGQQQLFFIDLILESGSNAFLASVKPKTANSGWQFAFGFYLHDTLSLSDVPLVGKELGNKFSIKDIHLAYISAQIDTASINIINQCLTSNKLATLGNGKENHINKGINAGVTFDFDNIIPAKILNIPAGVPAGNTEKKAKPTTTPSTNQTVNNPDPNSNHKGSADSATKKKPSSLALHKTFKINKSIGPVHIQSMGLGYNKGDLEVDITGGVSIGPLSMSLDGLGVANPLTKIDPSFSLNGLGINFESGPLAIGGALLKVIPPPANVDYEYEGMINLSLKALQLDAYGSYAKLNNDDTSLFIYAVMDYPLGGPSFCFVTGLAAAFGYNRNLIAPDVTGVAQYPLVSAATNNSATALTPAAKDPAAKATKILSQLNEYLPPQAGEYFAGIGIKFESFKVIDSFALLIAKFGKELAFDFFALSTYRAPDPEDPKPVAVVQLEVLGQLIPSEGVVMVQGQLTPASFLLDKDCHLTGGFAVGLWASGEYAGDFVYSFGGYGKHYTPPAHYPQHVPIIGLNWQIGSNLSISGGMYWAITPEIIAAGGFMHASFHASFFRAWFDLDAYFLIEWKPFHYEAGFHVDFGLKVRIDLLFTSIWVGFHMSANLAIHGPPFGGRASISLSVCTIHINFGAQPSLPPPLTWQQFDSAFLPKPENRVNINLVSGLVKTVKDQDGNDVWVINPKQLCIETNAFIPSTTYQLNYQQLGQSATTPLQNDAPTTAKFGIKPMALTNDVFRSSHNITLIGPDGDCLLKAVGIKKNAPKAIWGDASTTQTSGALITGTLSGFQLVPGKEPKPGMTQSVNRNTLAWELEIYEKSFKQETLTGFQGKSCTNASQFIQGSDQARKNVLSALGMQDEIPDATELENALAFDFVPNIITGSFGEPS